MGRAPLCTPSGGDMEVLEESIADCVFKALSLGVAVLLEVLVNV